MRHCLEFGAAAYVPKSLDVEIDARGDPQGAGRRPVDPARPRPRRARRQREASALVRRLSSLTPQQVRVLMMLSQGLLNKQIAYELSVSEATVKAHVSAILQKLGVESRTQAVILAAKIETHAGARADGIETAARRGRQALPRFCRLSIRSLTTPGSASVEVSPSAPNTRSRRSCAGCGA